MSEVSEGGLIQKRSARMHKQVIKTEAKTLLVCGGAEPETDGILSLTCTETSRGALVVALLLFWVSLVVGSSVATLELMVVVVESAAMPPLKSSVVLEVSPTSSGMVESEVGLTGRLGLVLAISIAGFFGVLCKGIELSKPSCIVGSFPPLSIVMVESVKGLAEGRGGRVTLPSSSPSALSNPVCVVSSLSFVGVLKKTLEGLVGCSVSSVSFPGLEPDPDPDSLLESGDDVGMESVGGFKVPQ